MQTTWPRETLLGGSLSGGSLTAGTDAGSDDSADASGLPPAPGPTSCAPSATVSSIRC